MDAVVHKMPTGVSHEETSLETMDVDKSEISNADDGQESGDVPHSPMIPASMEF